MRYLLTVELRKAELSASRWGYVLRSWGLGSGTVINHQQENTSYRPRVKPNLNLPVTRRLASGCQRAASSQFPNGIGALSSSLRSRFVTRWRTRARGRGHQQGWVLGGCLCPWGGRDGHLPPQSSQGTAGRAQQGDDGAFITFPALCWGGW